MLYFYIDYYQVFSSDWFASPFVMMTCQVSCCHLQGDQRKPTLAPSLNPYTFDHPAPCTSKKLISIFCFRRTALLMNPQAGMTSTVSGVRGTLEIGHKI